MEVFEIWIYRRIRQISCTEKKTNTKSTEIEKEK